MKTQGKKNRLLNYLKRDIYVRVGKSGKHGVGLFAIREIPKGVNPCKSLLNHHFIPIKLSELESLPKEVRKMILDYCAQEKGRIYIPAFGLNPIHLLHLMNHSDSPNVKAVGGNTTFRTIRRIKKGEELFSDYSRYDENYKAKM